MTKKKEPTIHLNEYKKRQLRKFAKEYVLDIIKNEEKTDINGQQYNYYDQLLEFNEKLSEDLTEYLLNYFDQDEMQIINKYAPIKKIEYIHIDDVLYTKYNENILVEITPKKDIFIPLTTILRENIISQCYVSLAVKKEIDYIKTPCFYKIPFQISGAQLSDVILYKKMIEDFHQCFNNMLCPYEYLINKKKTLNSLIKVWPQAAKFKDEWSNQEKEKETIQTSCGILNEDTVAKTIQKHQDMTKKENKND